MILETLPDVNRLTPAQKLLLISELSHGREQLVCARELDPGGFRGAFGCSGTVAQRLKFGR